MKNQEERMNTEGIDVTHAGDLVEEARKWYVTRLG